MQEWLLNDTLKKWKERLGLQNWTISISYGSYVDVNGPKSPGENASAMCTNRSTAFLAEMTIVPRDQCWNLPEYETEEFDIVHELLHLVLDRAEWKDSRDEEQAIELLTRALVFGGDK
jgi:hypothetical protein